jgi:hypothetical protein
VGGERHGEEVSELAVEVHGAALRVFDGTDEHVGQHAKTLGEQAQRLFAGLSMQQRT